MMATIRDDELARSGTGGEIARDAAMSRARDFAAGKIPLSQYASTLKAPNLAYQDGSISAKPTGPGQMLGLGALVPSPSLLPKPDAERLLEERGIRPELGGRPAQLPSQQVAPAAQAASPAAQPQQSTGLVRSVLNTPSPDTSIPEIGPRRGLMRDAFGPAIQNQGQTSGDRLASMGYATRQVKGAPGVTRLDGNGRTVYTDDQTNTADWIEGGMRPGVNAMPLGGQGGLSSAAQELSVRADRMRTLREENTALRDGMSFNAGGALSRQKTQDEIVRDMLTGQSRSGQRAAVQLMGDQQQAGIERQRMGIDQQRADTDRMTAGLAAEASRRDFADRDQISRLRSLYMSEQDPAKRDQLGRTLLTLQGKEPSDQSGRWMLADMETGTTDAMGNPVTRKVPVNPVTGQVFQPGAGQGGVVSGNGRSAPSYEQFAAQIRAKNQGAQIDDKTLAEAYMRQFGQ